MTGGRYPGDATEGPLLHLHLPATHKDREVFVHSGLHFFANGVFILKDSLIKFQVSSKLQRIRKKKVVQVLVKIESSLLPRLTTRGRHCPLNIFLSVPHPLFFNICLIYHTENYSRNFPFSVSSLERLIQKH